MMCASVSRVLASFVGARQGACATVKIDTVDDPRGDARMLMGNGVTPLACLAQPFGEGLRRQVPGTCAESRPHQPPPPPPPPPHPPRRPHHPAPIQGWSRKATQQPLPACPGEASSDQQPCVCCSCCQDAAPRPHGSRAMRAHSRSLCSATRYLSKLSMILLLHLASAAAPCPAHTPASSSKTGARCGGRSGGSCWATQRAGSCGGHPTTRFA
jgi:hypothetical protein